MRHSFQAATNTPKWVFKYSVCNLRVYMWISLLQCNSQWPQETTTSLTQGEYCLSLLTKHSGLVIPLLDTHSVCTKLSSTHATKCTDTNVGLPHVVQSPFLRNWIRSIPGRFTTECLYRVLSCMTSTTQPCFLDFTTDLTSTLQEQFDHVKMMANLQALS